MMKIGKAEQDKMSELMADIRELLGVYNSTKVTAEETLGLVIDRLNEKRDELHGILDEAASDASTYYDERSEKWQEGDRGSVYSDWKDELQRIAGEIAEEFEVPEYPDLEEPDWVGEVENAEFVEFTE